MILSCLTCSCDVPPPAESKTNRLLDQRVIALRPCQLEAELWKKRQLRYETRRGTAMPVARMNQKGVAQIYCSRLRRCSLGQGGAVLLGKPTIDMPISPRRSQ